MGWKNVKQHFGIGHIVTVHKKGLCIGSPYIHDIMIVSMETGEIVKHYEPLGGNGDLERYESEMRSEPSKVLELIKAPDTFSQSIRVFTWREPEIVEEYCEALGWPNVTHAGNLMYENMYATDRATVIRWALRNAEASAEEAASRVTEKRAELAEAKKWLLSRINNRHRLARLENQLSREPEKEVQI